MATGDQTGGFVPLMTGQDGMRRSIRMVNLSQWSIFQKALSNSRADMTFPGRQER